MWLFVILVLADFSAIFGERRSYEGYQEWKVHTETKEQRDLLRELEQLGEIDMESTSLLVSPENIPRLRHLFAARKIGIEVTNANIQRSLDETYARLDAKLAYDPNEYNTYEDIIAELRRLAGLCADGVTCELETIGQSTEGRDLVVFHMTKEGDNRQGHMVDSLIHAREWLAGATVMRILDHLVTGYGGDDDDVTTLVDTYDFHFLPVVNPDGYEYTFTNDRFWRKSRNVNEDSSCIGTDLNRNFDFQWGPVGSSSNPCSDTYRGSSAASEPEVQAVQTTSSALASDLLSYLSVHTTAYVWLSPYGYALEFRNCSRPDDHADIQRAGQAAVDAIEVTSGDNWVAGTACEVLYEANGVTVDYAYSVGIKYSYTPELRGPGFDPPPSAIQPSFEEIWNGYVAMIEEIETIEGL